MAAVHYSRLLCVPECSAAGGRSAASWAAAGAAQVTRPGSGMTEETASSHYLPA